MKQAALAPVGNAGVTSGSKRFWWLTLAVALIVMIPLNWLLGALLWLPFFSGLFGFFVEGLIVGGITFRLARKARPLPTRTLLFGIALLTAASLTMLVWFEFHHFSSRIPDPPRFASSRNEILAKEKQEEPRVVALRNLEDRIIANFNSQLSKNFSPGGFLGYARWVTVDGRMTIEVDGKTEKIYAEHLGMVWPIRTAVGAVLLALGLWLAFDALRVGEPVRNVLLPGEEYEEIDD